MSKGSTLRIPSESPDWLANWHQGSVWAVPSGNPITPVVSLDHPNAENLPAAVMESTVANPSALESLDEPAPLARLSYSAPSSTFPSSPSWQSLIQQLILAIHQSQNLQEVLHFAVSQVVQILQVTAGTVVQIQQIGGMGSYRATVLQQWAVPSSPQSPIVDSQTDPSQPPFSFELESCSLFRQALALAPQPLSVAAPGEEIAASLAPIFTPSALGAVLMMPLLYQGSLLGFLVVNHSQARKWHATELAWLELVSAQLSTALMQTYVLRQVQSLVEERTLQLRRSLEVQSKLYETSRRHMDQLHRLNRLKDEFLSSVSHELLTPLTSMRMAIQMLRQTDLDPQRSDRYLTILDQQCNQEIQLIKDLLALQQLQSQQLALTVEKVDLRELLPTLQTAFREKWQARHITLAMELPDRPLMLQADAESMQRILDELLNNAGKYAQPQTTVHLQVQTMLNETIPALVISVMNVGVGITAEELPYVFEQFRRGQYATQQAVPGTGLGLTLVRHLVQHLQGTITATSTPLAGLPIHETRFTLVLPQYHAA